jgi:hypothetical protein
MEQTDLPIISMSFVKVASATLKAAGALLQEV